MFSMFLARLRLFALLLIAGVVVYFLVSLMPVNRPEAKDFVDSPARIVGQQAYAPPAVIELGRDPAGRLGVSGRNFGAQEKVEISYLSTYKDLLRDYVPVMTVTTGIDGSFTQVLDIFPNIPAQGWLAAEGLTSREFAPPVKYQADPTPTPSPTSTPMLTPTPVDTPTPVPTVPIPTATIPSPVPTPTLDPNPMGSWYAQYYDNRDLAGEPFYFRAEPANPNSEWMCEYNPGWHPLQAEFQRQIISARWTGTFNFPTDDNYQFVVTVSDGVRIIVDGVAILNDWRFTSRVRTLVQNVPLTRGNHTIVIEYFHTRGRGTIGVAWRVAYPDWEGRYYNTPNFSGPVIAKRNDGVRSGPLELITDGSPVPGVNPDNFSVYWSRKFVFPHSGLYIFKGVADDGIRVFIDDREVFRQNTVGQPNPAFEFPVQLRGGPHVIQIHYFELTGRAQFSFAWEWVPPTPTPEPTPVL